MKEDSKQVLDKLSTEELIKLYQEGNKSNENA